MLGDRVHHRAPIGFDQGSVRENDPLEIPGSDALEGLGRCRGIGRVQAVFRRCHWLRSNAEEPRKRAPEDGCGLAVEVLDEVGHDQGTGSPMQKDDLCEEDVAADRGLVEFGGPSGIRLITENPVEGEVGAPLGKARGGECFRSRDRRRCIRRSTDGGSCWARRRRRPHRGCRDRAGGRHRAVPGSGRIAASPRAARRSFESGVERHRTEPSTRPDGCPVRISSISRLPSGDVPCSTAAPPGGSAETARRPKAPPDRGRTSASRSTPYRSEAESRCR